MHDRMFVYSSQMLLCPDSVNTTSMIYLIDIIRNRKPDETNRKRPLASPALPLYVKFYLLFFLEYMSDSNISKALGLGTICYRVIRTTFLSSPIASGRSF